MSESHAPSTAAWAGLGVAAVCPADHPSRLDSAPQDVLAHHGWSTACELRR